MRLGFEQGTAPQQGATEEALRMVEKVRKKRTALAHLARCL